MGMTKTICFVHGAWVSSACWDKIKTRYEKRGYQCVAPSWPHDERPVSELKRDPKPELANLGISEIVSHYIAEIKKLPEPPILIGHSFGGLFVQLLLDQGFGSAGIAIDPAPAKGVLPGLNAVRAGFPVLSSWAGWKRALTMSFKDFQWSFVHNMSEREQQEAYEKFVVPTPGKIYFQALAGIGTKVNFDNNLRAPLLLIAGEEDRTVEKSMVLATYKKYQASSAPIQFKSFPDRTHWIIAQDGWEEVADYAIEWAEKTLA